MPSNHHHITQEDRQLAEIIYYRRVKRGHKFERISLDLGMAPSEIKRLMDLAMSSTFQTSFAHREQRTLSI